MKAGILIIGSLLWEDGEDNLRRKWRKDRLSENSEAIQVLAPIRYGRRSSTRDNTFTMVLSQSAQLGFAIVCPCRREINSFEDLYDEATLLWHAESKKDISSRVSSNWGCVGIKVRDETNCPANFLDQWSQIPKSIIKEFQTEHARDESPIISETGLLQINWLNKVDGTPLDEVDILLAIPTVPSLTAGKNYYDVFDIAKAWLLNKKQDSYFYRNREHGIKTFQDEEILEEFWRHPGGCAGPSI